MMIDMQKEFMLNFSELKFLSVECSRCHTEITIDASDKAADEFPAQCPCCRESLGAFMKTRVTQYKDVYRALCAREMKESPVIRVRIRNEVLPSKQ
jgi:NAD-dependent SIR2 family protein deacetylase